MQRKKRRKALPRRSGKRAARRVAKPAASKQRRRKKKKARVKRVKAKKRAVVKRPAPKRRATKRPASKRSATKRPASKRRATKRPASKRRATKRHAPKRRAPKRPAAKRKPSKVKAKAPTRRGSPSPRARQPKRSVTPKKRKALPKKRKALPKKRKALPKKRKTLPKKRKKFLKLPPTGLLKEPTGVPLTERERGEIEEQRRLIRQEVERLKRLRKVDETRGVREPEAELREFVEGSIADVIEKDRTERQKRRSRRLAMEAVAPQALRDMLTMAREQTYDHRPVTNVRVLRNGWIVGVDAWGRDLRAIALVNTDNGKVRIRWRDVAPLPKRGGYVEDDGYESLKPKRYAVFGVFA